MSLALLFLELFKHVIVYASVCKCMQIYEKKMENLKFIHSDWIDEKEWGVGLHFSLEQVFGNSTTPGSKQAPFLTSAQISYEKVTPYRRIQQIKPWGTPPPDYLIPVSGEYQDRLAPSQKSNPPEALTGAFWTWVDPSVPWVIFSLPWV